jgi:hypothetical protein
MLIDLAGVVLFSDSGSLRKCKLNQRATAKSFRSSGLIEICFADIISSCFGELASFHVYQFAVDDNLNDGVSAKKSSREGSGFNFFAGIRQYQGSRRESGKALFNLLPDGIYSKGSGLF